MAENYLLLIEDPANKFSQDLQPKQYKQVAARIFLLSRNPRPHDSKPLEGSSDLWRVDQGEHRIIYGVNDAAKIVMVRRVGKRNDAEIYRGL